MIPEVIIFWTVKRILSVLRKDFKNNSEKETFLYKICQDLNIQRYNMFEQAKTVFIENSKELEPRYIDINMGWDLTRIQKKNPTIHLIMQNESPKNDSLGTGWGNNQPEFNEISGDYTSFHERSFTQRCNLMITTDNFNESVLIYHIIKSLLILFIPYLSTTGFSNVNLSGTDIQMNLEIADKFLIRNLMINFDYSLVVPNIETTPYIKNLFFEVIPKVKEDV